MFHAQDIEGGRGLPLPTSPGEPASVTRAHSVQKVAQEAVSHSIPAAGGGAGHLQRNSGQGPGGICSQGWRESAAGGGMGREGIVPGDGAGGPATCWVR